MNNLPSIFNRGSQRNPILSDMKDMQRRMDRIFDQFLGNGGPDLESDFFGAPSFSLPSLATTAFTPSCDVDETDTHYLLSFDLPGVKKDEIKVDLRDNMLTVSGERKEEREDKKKGRYRSERYYGAFERSFALPTNVKADQIEANYSDGVLSLSVPKSEPSQKQQIKIGEGKTGTSGKLLGKKEEAQKH